MSGPGIWAVVSGRWGMQKEGAGMGAGCVDEGLEDGRCECFL
jgi:hypothetical protein